MEWLQTLVPYILAAVGVIVGWIVRSHTEEKRVLRERLREEQRNVYRKLIDPYIKVISGSKNKGLLQQAIKEIQSHEYRKTVFDVILLGSDNVVIAHNKLIQNTYQAEETGERDTMEMMRLWGSLLLEIRKSLGHKDTELTEKDMLRAMTKDIDKYL